MADEAFSTVAYLEFFGYPVGYAEALQKTGKMAADPILTVADDFDFDTLSRLPGVTAYDLRRNAGGYVSDALPFYEQEYLGKTFRYDLIRFTLQEEDPVVIPALNSVNGASNAPQKVSMQITHSANGVFFYESSTYFLASKTAIRVRDTVEQELSAKQIAMHTAFNRGIDVALGDLVLEPGVEYLAAVECIPTRNSNGLFTVSEKLMYITFDWYGAGLDFLAGKGNVLSTSLWDQAAEDQPIGIWRWEDVQNDPGLQAYFEEVAEAYQYSARSFPVMTTDALQGIPLFHQQTAYITEGRDFTQEEYRQGDRVCIVSAAMAVLQGWCVGDKIDVSLFEYDGLLPENAREQSVYFTQRGGGVFDQGQYTIVGIWTEKDMPHHNTLQSGTERLFWNTILVPTSSVQNLDTVDASASGSRLTVHLKNGMMEEFLEAASKVTLSESADEVRITAFDQGYSQAQDGLQSMLGTAQFLLVLSSVLLVVAGVLLAFFYVKSQKQNMALMRLLGCNRRQAGTMAILGSLMILIPGGLLGMGAGHILTDRVAGAILNSTNTLEKPEYAAFREVFGVQAEVDFALSAQLPVSAAALALAAGLFLAGCLLFILLQLKKEPREALQDK